METTFFRQCGQPERQSYCISSSMWPDWERETAFLSQCGQLGRGKPHFLVNVASLGDGDYIFLDNVASPRDRVTAFLHQCGQPGKERLHLVASLLANVTLHDRRSKEGPYVHWGGGGGGGGVGEQEREPWFILLFNNILKVEIYGAMLPCFQSRNRVCQLFQSNPLTIIGKVITNI